MRIAVHIGLQLSPPPSSLASVQVYMGVNNANLEFEASEAFYSDGEDDSGSEVGSL